jgi:hypothetical protein
MWRHRRLNKRLNKKYVTASAGDAAKAVVSHIFLEVR